MVSYSDPYTYAVTEVNPVIKSGSRARQTNSEAAPVWSYKEHPANPEKSKKDNAIILVSISKYTRFTDIRKPEINHFFQLDIHLDFR